MTTKTYNLFEVSGIEIEYMLVDKQSLNIVPKVDQLLTQINGKITNEIAFNKIAASNELVNHVIELKMNGPQSINKETHLDFHHVIAHELSSVLDNLNCWLMPTSMHPFLTPYSPLIEVWQHGNKEIYQKYDEIFGCHGHGFSNIQSVHLNLPFANEDEFIKLHHAIRILLPLIPALCASSPVVEGTKTDALDNRLLFYKNNQARFPIIAGDIIPEPVSSIQQYYDEILNQIDDAISPLDPTKILESEWVNSRGAIARFDRNAIEIRLMDSQECPLADIACCAFINAILQHLIFENKVHLQTPHPSKNLKYMMLAAINSGLLTQITDSDYLQLLGMPQPFNNTNMHAILESLLAKTKHLIDKIYHDPLEQILKHGNLATRINQKIAKGEELHVIYQRLCSCLAHNKIF